MTLKNLPIGSIIAWENLTIPNGWVVCDGQNGTPDLRDKFIKGANNDGEVKSTGGSDTHTHTNSSSGSRSTHNHGGSKGTGFSGGGSSQWVTDGSGASAASTGHTHSVSVPITGANAHSHTIGATGSSSTIPQYIKRVFIRRNI